MSITVLQNLSYGICFTCFCSILDGIRINIESGVFESGCRYETKPNICGEYLNGQKFYVKEGGMSKPPPPPTPSTSNYRTVHSHKGLVSWILHYAPDCTGKFPIAPVLKVKKINEWPDILLPEIKLYLPFCLLFAEKTFRDEIFTNLHWCIVADVTTGLCGTADAALVVCGIPTMTWRPRAREPPPTARRALSTSFPR